jgi:Ca2+-transporting ATPase
MLKENNIVKEDRFYNFDTTEVISHFDSDLSLGLSSNEVASRLEQFGYNKLAEAKKINWFIQFISHFKDALVFILLAAAVVSFAVGKYTDSIVIVVIVFANAVMGFFQERKAENAIEALKKYSQSNAKVLRDGQVVQVLAEELVPGDIVVIDAGDKIPSDCRVLESFNLQVSESMLTGESNPIEKGTKKLDKDNLALGDRVNMLYKDSVVVFGRGTAIVVATGVKTEIGKISLLLNETTSSKTTLEIELSFVAKILTLFALISAAIVFVSIWLTGNALDNAFFTAISIAIAVVPEGIPAVVTTVLAISVSKLAANKATARKMQAVETLGSINAILTDKTGTLTKNQMFVVNYYNAEKDMNVESELSDEDMNLARNYYEELIQASVLCNDVKLSNGSFLGDPTEICLVEAGIRFGLDYEAVRQEFLRVYEFPFSSDTKRMIVICKKDEDYYIYVKGAFEVVSKNALNLTKDYTEKSEQLSANGIRNLAFGFKKVTNLDLEMNGLEEFCMSDLNLLGLIGAKDPLREDVKDAVKLAQAAGIYTVMITGDHRLIAQSIALELGIITGPEQVMDGTTLGDREVSEIQKVLKNVRVFSRVSPEQKLRIVQATKANGDIVAVTGDGVNDAPAIKAADIGVAMGITGTDVTKEVADIVLQDDNYSTIITAIKQGRTIFNNFIKFLRYQISCNLSGVFIVFTVTILGYSVPLLPIHILLLNLVSETGPSIALGLEESEKDIMQRNPRKSTDRLLTKKRWIEIVFEACLLTISALIVYFYVNSYNPELVITATLTTAFVSRLFHSLNSRSETNSIFSKNLAVNKSLYYNIVGTFIFFMALIYIPVSREFISVEYLDMFTLTVCILASLIPVIGVELFKLARR